MGLLSKLFGKKNNVSPQQSRGPSINHDESPKITKPAEPQKAYLLLFSASWCGPSKRFVKQIEAGGITCYSYVDTDLDENLDLSLKYHVTQIPTTILVDMEGQVIEKWIGEDDEDPGQTKFVNYIKTCGYDIIKYPGLPIKEKKAPAEPEHFKDKGSIDELTSLIESVLGSPDKPVKVEKKQLKDGSIYTGEAYVTKDGDYCPHGFGKQVISKDLELTGHFKDGYANGVMYANMHFAMVTGRYIGGRPYGWVVSAEKGIIFGVFKDDDFVLALTEQVMWIGDEYRDYDGGVIGVYPKRKTIVFGQPYKAQDGVVIRKAIGAQFTDEGDVYVGTDQKGLSKTGYFVKYGHDGYITIGHFVNGELDEELTWLELLSHYPKANNEKNRAIKIDTKKKYF